MEGVGGNGRMFLLNRPSLEEQISSLWGILHHTWNENAELRSRLEFQVSVSVCCVLVYFMSNVVFMLVWQAEEKGGWFTSLAE